MTACSRGTATGRLLIAVLTASAAVACGSGPAAAPSEAPHPTPSQVPPRATSTPTARPTPTRTPPPPNPYFLAEFESEAYYWDVHVTSGEGLPAAAADAGFFVFELNRPNLWAYGIFRPRNYADVRVDTRFELRGTGPSSMGVLCRYSPERGWYEFNMSPDGLYSVLLGEWVGPEIARYTPIVYDESEYIDRRASSAEIGLACEGQTLWLYINGKLIRKLDVTRFGLTDGKIGISAASFENAPVTVAFDWLRVGEP